MKQFKLPDLGEGLQEAEIVEWHVQVGDQVEVVGSRGTGRLHPGRAKRQHGIDFGDNSRDLRARLRRQQGDPPAPPRLCVKNFNSPLTPLCIFDFAASFFHPIIRGEVTPQFVI